MESYKNMQRMKGSPGAEATPEQLTAYREANGIPEVANAESYGLTLPDELKDIYGDDALNEIAKVANESSHLGHREMMQAIVAKFTEMEVVGMSKAAEASEQAHAAKLAESVKMLEADPSFQGQNRGAALETSSNALNAALSALGVDADSPEAREVASSPLMVRILHHFGSKTSQDSTQLPGATADLRSGEEQANDIISNPNNPDHQRYHDGDDEVGKKVLRLMGAKI